MSEVPDPMPPSRRVGREASVEEMLARAEVRRQWKTADSLSGSRFEHVVIDGEPFVVKYVCVDEDWIMRATGDLHCRQLEVLGSALLDALPAEIDHTVLSCASYTSPQGHRGAALLMRDVSARLIPSGGDPISQNTHRRFLEHMARMHAAYWDFHDGTGLFPPLHHYVFLTPVMAEIESERTDTDPVPVAVAAGWRALDALHPREAALLRELAAEPSQLTHALDHGPRTLVHGDWKLGNLGSHADGRTILIDWDRCGEGPPLVDLTWYLAVNCDRLPESKEAAIDTYRSSLEGLGIATAGWWQQQLSGALAGACLQLAWSKTGDPAEFGWWADRLTEWAG